MEGFWSAVIYFMSGSLFGVWFYSVFVVGRPKEREDEAFMRGWRSAWDDCLRGTVEHDGDAIRYKEP